MSACSFQHIQCQAVNAYFARSGKKYAAALKCGGDHIQRDAEVLANAAAQHEQMPHRVHVMDLVQRVKGHAARIQHAARRQQDDAAQGQALHQRLDGENDHPSHGQVTHHGDFAELFHIDGVEHDAHDGRRPHHAEQRPAQRAPQGDEGKGGIGARNEQKDGAMVQNLQHGLHRAVGAGVVQGGSQVQRKQGKAVHDAADHRPYIPIEDRQDDEDAKAHTGQGDAYPMRDRIEDLFPNCVMGQIIVVFQSQTSFFRVSGGCWNRRGKNGRPPAKQKDSTK